MYATTISGTAPTGPVNRRTGRNFIPGTSPKGNLARYISPGRIQGLAVFHCVNILSRVGQTSRPFVGYTALPLTASRVLFGQQDNQSDLACRKLGRHLGVKAVLF